MEICVKMTVVSKDEENMHSFYLEEGDTQISAVGEDRYFTVSELDGITYEEHEMESQGIVCYAVELTFANESVMLLATLEEFEDVLIELGLLEEKDDCSEILELSDYRNCEEEFEEVA